MTTDLDYLKNKPFLQYEDLTIELAPPSYLRSLPKFIATYFRGERQPRGAVALYTLADFTVDTKYHRPSPLDHLGKFSEARAAFLEVSKAELARLSTEDKAWRAARAAYAKTSTLAEATRLARDYTLAKATFESAVDAIEHQNAQLQAEEYSEASEYKVISVKCPVTGLYASHFLENLT